MHFVPLLCPVAVGSGSHWEPPFPRGSPTQGLKHVSRTQWCVYLGTYLPAGCSLPQEPRLHGSGVMGKRPLSPTTALQLHTGPRRGLCCLGFASFVNGAHRRRCQPASILILRPSQPGRSAVPALNFVTILLRLSSPSPGREQEACKSTESVEKKSFLTRLLSSGDGAHGKPASLSSPLSNTIYLIPATFYHAVPRLLMRSLSPHILLALLLRPV